jgi:NadR type nicotinamide-nucleotide adenylyltransferase
MNTVRNNKVKRIAIVGPECTGKTELAKELAAHYHTPWVPEFARTYIDSLTRPYSKEDLLLIARGQLRTEDELAGQAKHMVICDTNLLVIKIWSEFKYGECDPEILNNLTSRKYACHLLTDIDIPWQNDPQREHPDKREFFHSLFKKELNRLNLPFTEIRGSKSQRLKLAIKAIDELP